MKHRFHLSREIRERMENFGRTGDKHKEEEPPKEELPKSEPEKTEQPAAAPEKTTEAPKPAPEPKGTVTIVTRTDVGRVRKTNQDAVIEGERLCGVADGMGGHKGGEVASAGVRDSLLAQLKGKTASAALLEQAILAANRRVYLRAEEDESLHGMGTTLDVLWLGDQEIYIGHVGDSRVYLLRDGELRQVTDDHSMVMEMVRAGMITEEQAAVHPMRNIITRAVGTSISLPVDLLTEPRRKDDLWLICSDGLHGLVKKETIQDLMTRYAPEQAADELMSAAMEAGGTDNVSLVLLHDGEGAQ